MADQIVGLLSPLLRKQRVRAVQPHLLGRVLDWGCGIGKLAELLPAEVYTGVDLDDESVQQARHLHPEHAFLSVEEFDDFGSWDTIVALALIEHVADPVGLLVRFRRLLSDGGRIVLTTPNPVFDSFHGLGARLGLFSQEAHEEHQSLLNKQGLLDLQGPTGLKMVLYQRFLAGANQLAVFEKAQ
jgi:2-polyprenyl-3-methyl-5-hydroxy-6-metoxy-1,4-benzoquinol methylase